MSTLAEQRIREGLDRLGPGIIPFASLQTVGLWLGISPEGVSARFKRGQFPEHALLRISDRAVAVDTLALLEFLRAKNKLKAPKVEDSPSPHEGPEAAK